MRNIPYTHCQTWRYTYINCQKWEICSKKENYIVLLYIHGLRRGSKYIVTYLLDTHFFMTIDVWYISHFWQCMYGIFLISDSVHTVHSLFLTVFEYVRYIPHFKQKGAVYDVLYIFLFLIVLALRWRVWNHPSKIWAGLHFIVKMTEVKPLWKLLLKWNFLNKIVSEEKFS